MKDYQRIIPRDFFNEAKLLKCMGRLSLKILDAMLPEFVTIEIKESSESFDIQLTDDGYLFIQNYPVYLNQKKVFFGTNYNSKLNYPFIIFYNWEETQVFDEQGEFTKEFIIRAKCIKKYD